MIDRNINLDLCFKLFKKKAASKQRIVGSYDTSISDCIILIMPE